jgi:hypothetical protein
MSMKNPELQACSAVLQTTAPPRPAVLVLHGKYFNWNAGSYDNL